MNVRVILINAIYKKSFRVTEHDKSTLYSNGYIMNLVNIDARAVADSIMILNNTWATTIQLCVILYLLHNLLKEALWVGFGVMFAVMVLQGVLIFFYSQAQAALLAANDSRIDLIRQTFYSLTTIKLNAWESIFTAKILERRKAQLAVIKKFNFISLLFMTLTQLLPTILPVVSFIYRARSGKPMTPDIIFAALALFGILMEPLFTIAGVVGGMVGGFVSFGRICAFLGATERRADQQQLTDEKAYDGVAIAIESATFTYPAQPAEADETLPTEDQTEEQSKDDTSGTINENEVDKKDAVVVSVETVEEQTPAGFRLEDLNIQIKRGALVAVVGPVGCGKSSFLEALIGNMTKTEGKVALRGKVAYCSQPAWVETGTIRDNILFGEPYDADKYRTILRVCQLEDDLKTFKDDDQTLVGEQGINLSGGQKARLSLARALYADAAIYLLDDVIASLDAQVGRKILDECILGYLKDKTRVLVTHDNRVLSAADECIVIKAGRIVDRGSFDALAKSGAYSEGLQETLAAMRKKESSDDAHDTTTEVSKAPGAAPLTAATTAEAATYFAEEEIASGAITGKVFATFARAFRLRLVVVALIFAALHQAASVGSNYWLAFWESHVLERSANQTVGVFGAFGAGQVVGLALLNSAIIVGCYKAAKLLHNSALNGVFSSQIAWIQTQPIGRLINRFSKDIDGIDMKLWVVLSLAVVTAFNLVGAIIVIVERMPIIAAALVPLFAIYFFVFRFYLRPAVQFRRLDAVAQSPLNAFCSESLTGSSIARVFGKVDHFVSRAHRLADDAVLPEYHKVSAESWIAIRMDVGYCQHVVFTGPLLASFVILALSLLGVYKALEPAVMGLILNYGLVIIQTVTMLVTSVTEFQVELNAVERLDYYITKAPKESQKVLPSDLPQSEWIQKGEVVFNNVSFSYPSNPDVKVLDGVSLRVGAGEKVAVLGRTGSGKSTLVRTLFRPMELDAGCIMIDGKDVAAVGLQTLRSRIGLIPQDTFLFSGTYRANLDINGRHSDDEIRTVLAQASLEDFIASLPEGLDTLITDNGSNLSYGQRQLFCLARAMLAKPRLLVMDEATAGMDRETDELINRLLHTHPAFNGVTVLAVVHRQTAAMAFPRVVVLDHGRIVDEGDPTVLVKETGGSFASLMADA
ncbi:Multidrug resistance-associated protein 1 [Gaertneriomyces sp. JEL0708]|nr:Multidrug resistance-associated protein 1 [Gaertneriomyces sp. JEL0708]